MQSNRTATNALIALSLGLMAPAAFADDYPPRKAGLWQMTTKSSTGGAPEVAHQCIDGTDLDAMPSRVLRKLTRRVEPQRLRVQQCTSEG